MCELEGEEEARVLYRFRHNNQANVDYTHTDAQLVCNEHVSAHITAHLRDQADAEYYNSDCFCSLRDGCGGRIHPCELGALRASNPALYQRYVAAFFPGQGGGKKKQTRKLRQSFRKKQSRRH